MTGAAEEKNEKKVLPCWLFTLIMLGVFYPIWSALYLISGGVTEGWVAFSRFAGSIIIAGAVEFWIIEPRINQYYQRRAATTTVATDAAGEHRGAA